MVGRWKGWGAAIVLGCCWELAEPAQAAKYQIIYTFTGEADGSKPSDIVQGPSRSLFGIQRITGGTAIFELDPPAVGQTQWRHSLIYTQASDPNVGAITPKLVFDRLGNLYFGTSEDYSLPQAYYFVGSVFRLSPPAAGQTAWTVTRFAHHYSPIYPNITSFALSYVDSGGTLFGYDYHADISAAGPFTGAGAGWGGAIFKVSPPRSDAPNGIVSALTLFGDRKLDGSGPTSLALGSDGSFYGTTSSGQDVGASNPNLEGTVFRLTPPKPSQTQWSREIVAAFKDNAYYPPSGLILDRSLTGYGVAQFGGSVGYGAVFRVTPPGTGQIGWQTSILYSFPGRIDGSSPFYPLVNHNGILFGTTSHGGLDVTPCYPSCGTLFKLTAPVGGPQVTPWNKHLIHAFGNKPLDGVYPGNLIAATLPDGTFAMFGSTTSGLSGAGTVFEYIP